jgi:hypothetical protein
MKLESTYETEVCESADGSVQISQTDHLDNDYMIVLRGDQIKAVMLELERILKSRGEPPKKKTVRKQLPDDFSPNETGMASAQAKGINIPKELRKFCDYHTAKGNVMADWQAAWRTWVGNARPESARPISFREQDAQRSRQRWEEMTGQQHPENHAILDIFDSQTLEISYAKSH